LKRRFAVIVNPVAGRGKTLRKLKYLKELTEKFDNAVFEFYFTEHPFHAARIAEAIRREYDAIVAFGGDGTANEVMHGLAGTEVPFGIIPQGTGNDLARSLSMDFNIEKALEKIVNFDTKSIDVGTIGNRIFLNGVGIGFDGYVNHVSKNIRILKGPLIYFTTILFCLLVWKSIPIHLEVDGKSYGKMHIFLLAVGNGSSIGGGLKLTPNADMEDARFDICRIDNVPLFKIIFNLFRLKDGTISKVREVSLFRGRKLKIMGERPLPVHYDGEIYDRGVTEIDISIFPKSAVVITG